MTITLPKTAKAPENGWLEDFLLSFLLGPGTTTGRCPTAVSFRENDVNISYSGFMGRTSIFLPATLP